MRTDVAVLYVDPRGPYPKLVADWYDEARDATTYAGELPVVAHPPCAPWSKLRHFNKRHDPAHAVHAVAVVRDRGGVLEHPAYSKLWEACALPRPGALPDAHGGWTLEIDQCRWGHVGQKMTWLYIVGAAREVLPPIPGPAGMKVASPSSHVANASGVLRRCVGCCREVQTMSHQQRRRTPPAFAEWLIEAASKCARSMTPSAGRDDREERE